MTNNSVTQHDTTTTTTTPTMGDPSPYAEVVAAIQKALDSIAALIPAIPLTLGQTRTYIRRRLATKPELIDTAATATEETPALQGLLDVTAARDNLAFNTAFGPLFARMDRIGQDLKFQIDARHAQSSAQALTVFSAAKRLAQQVPGGAEVAKHVDAMKLVAPSGKKLKRTKVTTEPPVAAPAPTSTTPADSHVSTPALSQSPVAKS
jgi:hypothetical protein